MKEVYASLYHVIVSLLVIIFVSVVLYISKVPKEIFLVTLIFLLAVLILVILSYKGKIPLYKII